MVNLLVTCKKLSNRFKNTNYKEDLIQEGILGWLEAEAQGETSPDVLEGHALKAMRDFLNFKTKTVSVPSSGASRQALTDLRRGTYQTNDMTSLRLSQALCDDTEGLLEFSSATDTSEETDDHLTYCTLINIAARNLSYEDYKIFHDVYVIGLPQKEVAKRNGMSQGSVSMKLNKITEDIKLFVGE